MISGSQLLLIQSPHCKPTSRDNPLHELSHADGREEQVSVTLILKNAIKEHTRSALQHVGQATNICRIN